jgi:hypothetical protein
MLHQPLLSEASMRHAIRYEGGFERNFSTLSPGAADYDGDDDQRHPMEAWPAEADGLRFGFMERQGKRFIAVRVQHGASDIVLSHGVVIDAPRHLDGRRLGPEPLLIGNGPASALLADIMDANHDRFADLAAVRDQIRTALGPQGRGAAPPPTEEHRA